MWTIDGPVSSYSSLVTHEFSNVDNEDKIDPPIHVLYFLSGGAITLTLVFEGANLMTSSRRRSAKPGNEEEPPDMTMLLYIVPESLAKGAA